MKEKEGNGRANVKKSYQSRTYLNDVSSFQRKLQETSEHQYITKTEIPETECFFVIICQNPPKKTISVYLVEKSVFRENFLGNLSPGDLFTFFARIVPFSVIIYNTYVKDWSSCRDALKRTFTILV